MEYKFVASRNDIAPSPTMPQKHPTTAFITKLWDMVNDPSTDVFVRWSRDDIVDVQDVVAFSHQILPQYFSHSNWPSFVRQLNMYGFRRVKESVLSSKLSSNDSYQFMHGYFRRHQKHLLHLIRRKPQNSINTGGSGSGSGSSRRATALQESVEKKLDRLHEQLDAVESKYTAVLNEAQELHSIHYQQLELLSTILSTLANNHENNPDIRKVYEKVQKYTYQLPSPHYHHLELRSQTSSLSNSIPPPVLSPTTHNNHHTNFNKHYLHLSPDMIKPKLPPLAEAVQSASPSATTLPPLNDTIN